MVPDPKRYQGCATGHLPRMRTVSSSEESDSSPDLDASSSDSDSCLRVDASRSVAARIPRNGRHEAQTTQEHAARPIFQTQSAAGSFVGHPAFLGAAVAVRAHKHSADAKRHEVALLGELTARPHPNVVRFLDAYEGESSVLIMVMELMPCSLAQLLARIPPRSRVPRERRQLFTYQLVRALAHVHGMGITHRAVKPANILVDPETGLLKLADFGNAAQTTGDRNVPCMPSHFYSAPELIFDKAACGTKVDIWSLGCIVGELLLPRKPLFACRDPSDHLFTIMALRGTPTTEMLGELSPEASLVRLPPRQAKGWSSMLGSEVGHAVDSLLSQVLAWAPSIRPTALEVLTFEYFDSFRAHAVASGLVTRLPGLFELTPSELTGQEHLLPRLSLLLHGEAPLSGAVSSLKFRNGSALSSVREDSLDIDLHDSMATAARHGG
jgi:glycogen synthase kinase 3 beta